MFKNVEELDKKIEENKPVILNVVNAVKQQKNTVDNNVKTKSGKISELEQRILNIINLMPNKVAEPKVVYEELNANYPNEYKHKRIIDAMWQMAMKKGLLVKSETEKGMYFIKE